MLIEEGRIASLLLLPALQVHNSLGSIPYMLYTIYKQTGSTVEGDD